MKRILHMFMTVLVLAAVMLMPVTDTLAAEGEANASSAPGVDYKRWTAAWSRSTPTAWPERGYAPCS